MLNNQELTALLRQNGYKVTPQRLAVYEALANTKQHPVLKCCSVPCSLNILP